MSLAAVWAAGQRDLHAALADAVALARPASPDDAVAIASALVAAAPGEAGERLRAADAGLLACIARHAAGFAAVPGADALVAALAAADAAPVMDVTGRGMRLPTRGELPGMPAFSDRAFDGWFAAQGVDWGLGLYGEDRSIYQTPQFEGPASPERRTVHLGTDIFAPAGSPVMAPLPGQVAVVIYNADPLDYGHTLMLEHVAAGQRFHTLYGHLGASLPGLCRVGDRVRAGQVVAHLGGWPENGGWAAHLHFQIITDLLSQGATGNFHGVGHRSLWPVWRQISPDPDVILRLPQR
jgi:murein DD-endopeptidase MepM/ murein hydrolase activator NlpD